MGRLQYLQFVTFRREAAQFRTSATCGGTRGVQLRLAPSGITLLPRGRRAALAWCGVPVARWLRSRAEERGIGYGYLWVSHAWEMITVASNTGLPPETSIDALDLSTRLYNLLKRADITRLGELVLLTETAFLALRAARREDWTAIQELVRRTGIERDTVPLVYLIWSPSLLTLLFHQDIRRVSDLLGMTEAAVRMLPGISAPDVADLQHALARYGLRLHN